MVEYICENCGNSYTLKGNYTRHISRKFPCKNKIISCEKSPHFTTFSPTISPHFTKNRMDLPNEEVYTCTICQKNFSRKDALARHQKSNCLKNRMDLPDDNLIEKIKLMEKEIENLKNTTNDALTAINANNQIVSSNIQAQSNNTIINTTSNNTVNTNINTVSYNNINSTNNTIADITINVYGKEDLSHITDNNYKEIFRKFRSCIPMFIQMKHFDKRKPQNGNVYISNIKSNNVMLYKENRWILADKDETLQDMYEMNCDILIDKFEDLKDELDELTLEKFSRFIDKHEDETLVNSSKKEMGFLLYNNRYQIKRSSKEKIHK